MRVFHIPTRIIHGEGAFEKFAAEPVFEGKRVGLFLSASVFERYPEVRAFGGMVEEVAPESVREFVRRGEPDLAETERLRKVVEERDLQHVVAIGGGSVLDAAKAACGTAWSPYTLEEHFFQAEPLPKRKVIFTAVPTTAGTGTEVTPNAVLSEPEKGVKQSLRGRALYPDTAVVDPALTRGQPMHVAASSGADALVQAIEAYFSRHSSPITDALALEGVKLCAGALEDAVLRDDRDARRRMCTGSLMAGMAFANSRLGAVHGVVHPVGVLTGAPHGVCCAVFMPHVLELNREAAPEKYDVLERLFGEDPVEHLKALFKKVDLPADLKGFGLDPALFPKMAASCMRSGSLQANPRRMTEEMLVELFEKVL